MVQPQWLDHDNGSDDGLSCSAVQCSAVQCSVSCGSVEWDACIKTTTARVDRGAPDTKRRIDAHTREWKRSTIALHTQMMLLDGAYEQTGATVGCANDVSGKKCHEKETGTHRIVRNKRQRISDTLNTTAVMQGQQQQ